MDNPTRNQRKIIEGLKILSEELFEMAKKPTEGLGARTAIEGLYEVINFLPYFPEDDVEEFNRKYDALKKEMDRDGR